MKRRAFTLIELLVTATLFVVVAGYAVVIFSNSVGLSAQSARSAGVAGQARQTLDVIGQAFTQSSTAIPAAVFASSESGTTGSVLVFAATIPDNLGALTASTEERVYCAAGVGNSKFRLALFTVTGSYIGGSSAIPCNAAGIASLFSGSVSVSGPVYVTDITTNVTRFTAVPEQFDITVPNPNPSAMHLVMTTNYDPSVGDPSATDRADNGSTAHAVTVEATAVRNLPRGILPFTGF